jgi:hypothetical protein
VHSHRRAWIIRAAVTAVVAAATLFGLASPAMAVGETITDISLDPATVQPGQPTIVHFTVNAPGGSVGSVSVTSSNSKVTCGGVCSWSSVSIPATGKPYDVKFLADGIFQADDTSTITIQAGAASSSQVLTIKVPQVPTVPEVSGMVVNLYTGQPVQTARVYLQDSATPPHSWDMATDKDGKFKFISTPAKPIMPGTLAFRVEKDSWQSYDHAEVASPGAPVLNLRFAITQASASPNATATGGSTSQGTLAPTLDDGNSTPAGQGTAKSGFSWVLIGIGGVLVLLGVGAIALLVIRRRDESSDDDDDERGSRRRGGPTGGPGRGGKPERGSGLPPSPRRGGPGGQGGMGGPHDRGGRGHGDPRGMRPPVSPGPRGADQTMIARSPLADIPTQLHGRLPSEHADPYLAPGRHGAHGQPSHAAPAPGYGGYGQPDPYGQMPPGGYGQQGQHPGQHGGQHGGGGQHGTPPPRPGQQPRGTRRVDWLED